MADFQIKDHGSIQILQPLTEAAKEWCNEHIPEDAQWWAGGVAVETRFIDPIVEGILTDGLEIEQ